MTQNFQLKPDIELGIVPTHIKFVGGIVPDENAKLPRNQDGELLLVAEMRHICSQSPVRPSCCQIPFFAGADPADIEELVSQLKALDLNVHAILMVGGANPLDPNDEDAVVDQLVSSLKAAIKYKMASVSSTSIEEWMNGPENADLEKAIAQNVIVHTRAARESGLLDSDLAQWHIEFLRPGEMKTFTNLAKAWSFVKAANKEIGKNMFKLLVDAAHMGDSGLTIEENQKLISEIAAADHMGIFHASTKTTRGCLTGDDGWVGATLRTAAETGKLKTVFVEIFHHEDPALEGLRNLDAGHGVDTRDGRTYSQTVIDGLVDTARRLNNLNARGVL